MHMRTFFLLPFLLAFSASAQQPNSLNAAQQQFDNHNYQEASTLYRAILDSDPENIDALSGLVNCLEVTGQWKIAIPVLQHLVALQPANASRLNQLGRWESWSGEAHGAREWRSSIGQ